MILSRGTPTQPNLLFSQVLLPVDTTGAVGERVCDRVCVGEGGIELVLGERVVGYVDNIDAK